MVKLLSRRLLVDVQRDVARPSMARTADPLCSETAA
jgi:hypothetical protein